jgi:hypothetical protein
MRAALTQPSLSAGLRVSGLTAAGIGRYLRTQRGGPARYRRYYEGLAEVANTLAPFVGNREESGRATGPARSGPSWHCPVWSVGAAR